MSGGSKLLKFLVAAGVGYAAARWIKQGRRQKQLTGRVEPPAAESPFELPRGSEIAWLPAPSGSVRVVSYGDRRDEPVCLFVHGLGGRAEQWAPLLHELGARKGSSGTKAGARVRCAALDLPGHGQSDAADELDLAALSGAVAAAADGLGLRRFVLVGHSLGAAAALDYAGKHPRRVAGLLLLDPNGDLTRIPKLDRKALDRSLREDAHGELAGHYRQFLVPSSDEVTRHVLRDLQQTPPQTLHRTYLAGMSHSPLEGLDRYRRAGGRVAAVVTPWNDLPYSLHRLRPELPTRLMEGTGHWLMMDDPETVAEILTDFAAEVGAVH